MKAFFISSVHSAKQRDMLTRVLNEMSSHLTEIQTLDEDKAKEVFGIRATPALIILRDDLQGEHLLDEAVDGQLLVTAELIKAMQEEDLAIHQKETHRMDNFIKAENNKVIDEYTLSLLAGGVI